MKPANAYDRWLRYCLAAGFCLGLGLCAVGFGEWLPALGLLPAGGFYTSRAFRAQREAWPTDR